MANKKFLRQKVNDNRRALQKGYKMIGPTVYERTCADNMVEIQKQAIISGEILCRNSTNRVEKVR